MAYRAATVKNKQQSRRRDEVRLATHQSRFAWMSPLIQQVFGPDFQESLERLLPVVGNPAGVLACLNPFNDPARADQRQSLIEFKVVREKLVEGGGNFHAHFRRIERLAVHEDDLDSVADLARKAVLARSEVNGEKAD